jgi:6-pyruvoyltetrahydropterin/6-carboxytetrahydropterin synthase
MFELCLKGEFASAHFLRGYQGKCRNMHGHTWKVEIFLRRDQLDDVGMARDFAILKKDFRALMESLDHVCLNDLEHFKIVNPTAENLAKHIYERFASFAAPMVVAKVTVWESDVAAASYWE